MATCPLCDYTGPRRSVEAHVSGSTDEAHQGEVGRNYRERIRSTVGDDDPEAQEAEKATPPTASEGSEDATPEAGGDSTPEPREGSGGLALAVGTAILGLALVVSSSTSSGDGSSTSSDGSSDDGSGQATQTATQPRDGLDGRFQ